MAQVTVRNLDEATVAALKTRAAAKGISLEQELRVLLTSSARPTRRQVREVAAAIRARTRVPVAADLEALVRQDRDR
ncbi:MAG TPA: plasmid stabilization protein [Thermoanaerobaculia bacterium]|nr:plasmid stabilization protein [Thermoanaerobaculia bacterium]